MSEYGNIHPRPNPPVATRAKLAGLAGSCETMSRHKRARMSSTSRVRCAKAARPSPETSNSRLMRADSSLREPRNSLINEDAAIMKVIHPVPLPLGKATSTAACQMLSGCVPVALVLARPRKPTCTEPTERLRRAHRCGCELPRPRATEKSCRRRSCPCAPLLESPAQLSRP